jgi:hypothetical protein
VLSLIHTLYNSLQHALILLSLLRLHRLSPGNGFQSRSFLSFSIHVLTGRGLSHESSIAPIVLLIISRHGLHRKHSSSISVNCCLADRAENTILLLFEDRCLPTATVQSPISWSSPSNGSTFHNMCSISRHWMEADNRLHSPSASTPRKETLKPFHW